MTDALTPTIAAVPAGPIGTPNTVVTTFTLTNSNVTSSGAFALALTETNGGSLEIAYSINGGGVTSIGPENAGDTSPYTYTIPSITLAASAVLTLTATSQIPLLAGGGDFTLEAAWSGAGVTSGNTTATVILTDLLKLTVTPAFLIGVVGTQVPEFTLVTQYGAPAYTYSATGLPNGVAINSATGALSGEPTQAGTFEITFKVTDANSATSTAEVSFTVWADNVFQADIPVPEPIVPNVPIETPDEQWFVVGTKITPFGLTVPAGAGFTSPLTYSASWLPQGLSISSSTGQITGTPLVSVGSQEIFLYVTDANGLKFTGALNLIIVPAVNAADASQEMKQSGMLLSLQRPPCFGVTGELPTTSVETIVLDSVAAMATAYP